MLASSYANFKIVVADNASSDDSVAFLKKSFPQVETILLKQNYGFAKGYNEALKQVSADYYILLNSDVEVTPGWIEPIIQLMGSDVKIGACQPKLLAYNQKNLFEYAGAAGGWLDAFGYPFSRGRIFDVCEEDTGQYESIQKVFWASGAALFIRSNLFHKLGGFDEFFFAHQEEIDLCWRAQLAGYEIYCCPQSVVYHVGGGTLPKGNSRKTFLNFRNNHIMLAKNLPLAEKWWKIPFRLLLDQAAAWKGLLGGDNGYFIAINRAHFAYYRWLLFGKKNILAKPKSLKSLAGVYKGNVIWQHFIKHRNKFSEIIE